jgi:hypothetical protein
MGWSIRRSIRFGQFRFNVTKKGVGGSVGIPGVRVGQDASGRKYSQVSIPGTGIYRRDYASVARVANTIAPPSPQAIQRSSTTASRLPKLQSLASSAKYLAGLIGLAVLIWSLLRLLIH